MAKRTPVPAKPVPQTEEEAQYHADEHVRERDIVAQLEVEEKQALADLKQEYADKRKPHEDARDEHEKLAQAWGEANRNGRKTIKFPNGRELRWRLPSSPSLLWVPEKFLTIVRVLLRFDWEKYLAIEFKKTNIKADLPELQKKSRSLRRYLGLDDTEYFRIK